MIEKNKVCEVVNEWLQDKEYFLVEVNVAADNKITVEIDHKEGVWIEDCVELSRFVESRIPVINKEVLGATCWSFEDLGEYNKAMVLAANLRDDGQFAIINTLDASIIRDVTLSVAYIDQTTGEVIYY